MCLGVDSNIIWWWVPVSCAVLLDADKIPALPWTPHEPHASPEEMREEMQQMVMHGYWPINWQVVFPLSSGEPFRKTVFVFVVLSHFSPPAIQRPGSLSSACHQVAHNGVDSENKNFGWGPAHGSVFAKHFVEFFCSASKIPDLLQALPQYPHISFVLDNASVR